MCVGAEPHLHAVRGCVVGDALFDVQPGLPLNVLLANLAVLVRLRHAHLQLRRQDARLCVLQHQRVKARARTHE
eukprot:3026249-Pleurochrysis_carterae.AAC.2